MSNCNLIMFRASDRTAPADRQAEDPQSVSVQDKACLYDRVIPFEEIATLLKHGRIKAMAKRKTRSLNSPAKYPDRADRMILGDGCIFSTDCRKPG